MYKRQENGDRANINHDLDDGEERKLQCCINTGYADKAQHHGQGAVKDVFMSNHHERPEDDDEGRQIKEYWRDHSAAPFPSSAAAGAGASTGFSA